ncbi:hypothetical protein DPMN_010939 [Dreissena polymorpha]|uniref:Uncharacterized protein n=2 Tax=Dreissena polymorpha TaxID=45954 RepID=A0A9D4N2N3_DREPO|nr:hypothetical protein DPMN_010939 [Dreissena polymorpha]
MRLKREEIWDTMDEQTKATYGREYLDEIYNNLLGIFKMLPDDLTPVIRAMRSGLLSKRPRERYPCGAGADFVTYIFGLLPIWISDKVTMSMSAMPKTAKPRIQMIQ